MNAGMAEDAGKSFPVAAAEATDTAKLGGCVHPPLTAEAEIGRPAGTARMFMRALRAEDFAHLHFLGESGVAGDTGARWAASLARLDPRQGGGWAICRLPAATPVGLAIYDAVVYGEEAVIAYGLEVEARGQGWARRAVADLAEQLLDVVGFKSLFADVELSNVASRRLLFAVGFRPLTVGATPGVEVGSGRPGQRWVMGRAAA